MEMPEKHQEDFSTESDDNKDDTVGGTPTNDPNPEAQSDTGYSGTTNAVSEDRQHKDAYKIAPEDTMIGYDGDDSQMDMDLGDEDASRSGKTGVDDND